MILGRVIFPKTKYPENIVKGSRSKDIAVSYSDLPEWAEKATPKGVNPPEWITCLHAWPHEDAHLPHAGTHLFLTIALRANHQIGDVECCQQELGPGHVFVVDPLVVHWLAPQWDEPNPGFISVQWTIPRRGATACVRHVMCALGGQWRSKVDIDHRYKRFV